MAPEVASTTIVDMLSVHGGTVARPRPAPMVRLVPQILLLAGAVAAYFLVRGATEAGLGHAVRNAHLVVRLERWLGLYHEPGLQAAVAGQPVVVRLLNGVYIWGHWPVIVATLLWLASRHPAVYLRVRNAMLVSGAVGLVVFLSFPVAPPRLAGLGMVDTVTQQSQAYRVLQPTMFTNQYAAMPSLHVGWDLLVGLAIAVAAGHWSARLAGLLMPVLMVVAVVLTANHYLIDAVVGAGLTTACWLGCGWWQRRAGNPAETGRLT